MEKDFQEPDQEVVRKALIWEIIRIITKAGILAFFIYARSIRPSVSEEVRLGDFARLAQMEQHPGELMDMVGSMVINFHDLSHAPAQGDAGEKIIFHTNDGVLGRREEEEGEEDDDTKS